MFSSLEPTDIYFLVVHGWAHYEAELMALGGYRTDNTVMILFRYLAQGLEPMRDAIVRIGPDNNVYVGEYDDQKYLTDECWDTFDKLDEGDNFRLGEQRWQKMYLCDVRQAVGDRTFVAL